MPYEFEIRGRTLRHLPCEQRVMVVRGPITLDDLIRASEHHVCPGQED